MYKGIAASPGIVIGPAYVISKKVSQVNRIDIPQAKIDAEVARMQSAVEITKADICAIKERIVHDIGSAEAEIFNAYLMLLSDPTFVGKAEEIIRKELVNTEYALQMVLKNYAEFSNRISDSYLKERSRDINSLVDKIIHNLEESGGKDANAPADKYIIIAQDLSPADTADMNKDNVMGL